MSQTKQMLVIADSRNMQEVKDGEVDLVITSPPYWNLKNYGKDDPKKGYEQYINDIESVLKEVKRVLKDGRFACINVGTAVTKTEMKHIPSDVIKIMNNLDFVFKKEIIWMKPKGTQGLWQRGTTKFLKKEPYPGFLSVNIMHEYILIFQKKGEYEIEFSPENMLTESFIKEVCWSIWPMRVSYTKGHPAPFPEELPKRLIQLYSLRGDTVLDPFAGSGTVMQVARDLARNSILYEKNGEYIDLIKEKVAWGRKSLLEENIYQLIIRAS